MAVFLSLCSFVQVAGLVSKPLGRFLASRSGAVGRVASLGTRQPTSTAPPLSSQLFNWSPRAVTKDAKSTSWRWAWPVRQSQ